MMSNLNFVILAAQFFLCALLLDVFWRVREAVKSAAVNEKDSKSLSVEDFTSKLDNLISERGSKLVGLIACEVENLSYIRALLGVEKSQVALGELYSFFQEQLREGDLLLFSSPDEILIAIADLPTKDDLIRFNKRIVASFNERNSNQVRELRIISGLAVGEETTDSKELIQMALIAKTTAKFNRKNQQIYSDELKYYIESQADLEEQFRQALAGRDSCKDNKDLSLYYQPVVNVNDSVPLLFEALLRWDHPQKGVVGPNLFMPIAKRLNIENEVDEFVLEKVFAQLSTSQDEYRSLSINLSSNMLCSLNFVEQMRNRLVQSQIAPELLCLEVSELDFLKKFDQLEPVLNRLSNLGIKLAVDDFGASQASLGLLKKIPFIDFLKLDRSFTENVASNQVDRNLTSAVIELASEYNLEVIAEGVESQQDANALNEIGITYMQGFYFQAPRPGVRAILT